MKSIKNIVLLVALGSLSACVVPAGESCPGTDQAQMGWESNQDYADSQIPEGDCVSAAERKLFELINQDRESFADEYLQADKSEDLAQPVEIDCDLVAAARAHSRDMLDRNFFAHVNPDGLTPFDRVSAATDRFAGVGENIAWGGDTYGTEFTQDSFMDEPAGGEANHRGNILNSRFTHVGVGIVVQDGFAYTTQDFGIAGDETIQYTRARCWDDAKCTQLMSAQLVSKKECKDLGGKGWGPDSNDCNAP